MASSWMARILALLPGCSRASACAYQSPLRDTNFWGEFPGDHFFQIGAENAFVTCARAMLMERGGASHCYLDILLLRGWCAADVRACWAFQQSQGWDCHHHRGMDKATWRLLVNGEGQDINGTAAGAYISSHPSTGAIAAKSAQPPGFPGREVFGPRSENVWVLLLRLRLAHHGFYPGTGLGDLDETHRACRWDEDVRAACTTFQLAQGWRGECADGYPTELTWRQLWNS